MPFPPEHRELLAFTNGGLLKPNLVLRVPDGTTSGAISVLPAEKVGEVTRRAIGGYTNRLAWARDGSGNLLTVDDQSQVYFWDHDTDEQIAFGCSLSELEPCFFSKSVVRSSKPTSAPLVSLIESNASHSTIKSFMKRSLERSPEVAGALLNVAVNADRGDIVRMIPASDAELGTALRMAAGHAALNAVEALLSLGANINAATAQYGLTPLMEAASSGQSEMVRRLLENGADPGLRTVRGMSAANIAGASGHLKLKEFLLSKMKSTQ